MVKIGRFLFLTFFWWCVLTPNTLNTFSLHPIYGLIDEALQLLLVLFWLNVVLLCGGKMIVPQYIKTCGIIVIVISVVSAIFNAVPVWNVVQFIFVYSRPVVMILIAVTFFDMDDVPLFVKSIVTLFTIQIILNFTWLLHINPIPHWKTFIDISTGTFESCATMAYFSVIIMFCCFTVISNDTNIAKRMFSKSGVIGVLAILQLYFTFTTHALVIGSISSIGFIFDKISRMSGLALILFLFIVIMVSFGGWEKSQFHSSTKELIGMGNIVEKRLANLQYSLKVDSLYLVLSGKVSEIKTRWLGAGPGMYASIVAYRGSSLYRKYHDPALHKRYGRRYMDSTSVTGYPHSGVLALLGDIGWAGFLTVAYMNICILWGVIRFVRTHKHLKTDSPDAFIAFIPSFIFYIMMDTIWDLGMFKILSIGFWVWAGVLLKEIQKDYLNHAETKMQYSERNFVKQQ